MIFNNLLVIINELSINENIEINSTFKKIISILDDRRKETMQRFIENNIHPDHLTKSFDQISNPQDFDKICLIKIKF